MKRQTELTWRVFRAEGLSLEKLVRLCADEELVLRRLKRITPKALEGRVSEGDYERLCILAKDRGWRIISLGYAGPGLWIKKLKERKGLTAGLLLASILIAISMQFIWQVRILGGGAYDGDVRAYLIQKGITVGTYKGKVDLKTLREDLEWRYPKIAWVYITLQGSTLTVRLVEGVPTPEVAPYGEPRDLVASRGGMIVSVEPLSGTALVKAGDVVVPGQTLIRGIEKRGEEQYIQTKARGRVLARVWDEARVRVPVWETVLKPTGRKTVIQTLETPWLKWQTGEKPAFEASENFVEKWPLPGVWWPLTVKRETVSEVIEEKKERPIGEVEEEAKQAALRALLEKTGTNDDLVDKWVDCCMIKSGIVEACAYSERICDITAEASAS